MHFCTGSGDSFVVVFSLYLYLGLAAMNECMQLANGGNRPDKHTKRKSNFWYRPNPFRLSRTSSSFDIVSMLDSSSYNCCEQFQTYQGKLANSVMLLLDVLLCVRVLCLVSSSSSAPSSSSTSSLMLDYMERRNRLATCICTAAAETAVVYQMIESDGFNSRSRLFA